jgi:kumamolisin
MSGTVLIPLPFSDVPFIRLLKDLGNVPEDQSVTITVSLKPKKLLKAIKDADKFKKPTKQDLKKLRHADPDDATVVEDYLKSMGFTITDSSIELRHVQANGTVQMVKDAFGVVLNYYSVMSEKHFGHDGPVMIPVTWKGKVEEIFGLNSFPILSDQFHKFLEKQEDTDPYDYPPIDDCNPPKTFTVAEIKEIYKFPEESRGEGQTIAMIALDGGFYQEDLEKYWASIGLSPPGTEGAQCWPEVEVFGENNPAPVDEMTTYLEELLNGEKLTGTNGQINQRSWTLEITMDIELMGAMANAAKLQVYFIGGSSIQSFYNLLNDIKKGQPDVVSGSFAVPEKTTPKTTLNAINNAFENCFDDGIDFCFAAGNNGAYPTSILGKKVLTPGFPASTQFVTGCGGVLMRQRNDGLVRPIFNQLYGDKYPMASGGGVSTHFEATEWQKKALPNYKMRVSPDFCFTTDLKTSPLILVADMEFMSGGTSAATVYISSLKARLRSALGDKRPKNMPLAPLLWEEEARETFHPCRHGNSCIPPSTEGAYQAEFSYDMATGWGWPNGEALLAALDKVLTKKAKEESEGKS